MPVKDKTLKKALPDFGYRPSMDFNQYIKAYYTGAVLGLVLMIVAV